MWRLPRPGLGPRGVALPLPELYENEAAAPFGPGPWGVALPLPELSWRKNEATAPTGLRTLGVALLCYQ